MKQPGLFSQARLALAEFWAARAARERALLAAAAVFVALALCYAVLLDPALTGRAKLHKNLPELRQQVAQLQTLAGQAAQFSAQPAPQVAVSEQGIKAALAQLGLQPQSVMLAGGLVKVQLNDASFAALLEWLNDMQKTMRLAVVEANIAALAQADRVSAALTLRQPGSE